MRLASGAFLRPCPTLLPTDDRMLPADIAEVSAAGLGGALPTLNEPAAARAQQRACVSKGSACSLGVCGLVCAQTHG